jgi:N utilization substance protein B
MAAGPPRAPDGSARGPGIRRLARELALKLLFQRDLEGGEPAVTAETFEAAFSPENDPENALALSAREFRRAWPLALELFFGGAAVQGDLDARIGRAAINWTLPRMAPVDRGLIRLAYYEMLHRVDIPARVSLNEALEMAKIYGDDDSVAFINGVLDRLLRDIDALA